MREKNLIGAGLTGKKHVVLRYAKKSTLGFVRFSQLTTLTIN